MVIKMKKLLKLNLILLLLVTFSCEDTLDEVVYSQLAPENFLVTQEGLESILFASYSQAYQNGYSHHSVRNVLDWCTDIEWETGGGENLTAVLMINFTWDPTLGWLYGEMWQKPYRGIRNANIVLENLEGAEISTETKTLFAAEARFLRALAYSNLYNWYGPVPLRLSTSDELYIGRSTDEEMKSFIETELLAVIPDLPAPGAEAAGGRATSGAARALLAKFYLNTKQWQKAADMAKAVMDMGKYSLYPDYEMMFHVENEINSEFILSYPQLAGQQGCNYMNGAFPPGFKSDPRTGLQFISSWRNWAAQYRLYDDFFNSFEDGDLRKNLIISEYINNDDELVSLLDANNTRSFKYWPDPNGTGNEHGNDVAAIRYSDILLSRAEALNEVNGPNQESVDLINLVRDRAGLEPILLTDFGSKEALRMHLLDERSWEFYSEGLRREDQIRMGTFISSAIARGHANAKDFRVRFPIPQSALDANPELKQNDGY